MPHQIISLSHSTRPMDLPRCELQYLTKRYADPARLHSPPPLSTLTDEYNPNYTGALSLWRWDEGSDSEPELIRFIRKNYKVQHATITHNKLIICGTAFLEVYDLSGSFDTDGIYISHPWFAGGHTVYVDPHGLLVVSCSAPDAVLIFDLDGSLVRQLILPHSLYGSNYDLRPEDDLRRHYIHNDLQRTHLNSAFPATQGVLCSLLIQGAVGLFGQDGSYHEITRGFVGCHGARTRSDLDGFYFSDSANGRLIEMSWQGEIQHAFAINSCWLHDSLHVGSNRYLMAPSDRNTLELWDSTHQRQIWSIYCGDYGSTTQFISIHEGLRNI